MSIFGFLNRKIKDGLSLCGASADKGKTAKGSFLSINC